MDGGTRFLTEQTHHVEFADEKLLRQFVDVEIVTQMAVDVTDNFADAIALGHYGTGVKGIIPLPGSAQLHQQTQKAGAAEDILPEIRSVQMFLKGRRHLKQFFAAAFRQPQNMPLFSGKNGQKVAFSGGAAL